MTESGQKAGGAFDRDRFLRRFLIEVMGLLEEVVGPEGAEGIIARAGMSIGRWLDRNYRDAHGAERLDPRQVAAAMVEIHTAVDGELEILEATTDRIVLDGHRCPFGRIVIGRPQLCMLTSTFIGRIAADNLGYARIDLERTIARGDGHCRIVAYLNPAPGGPVRARGGHHEYYASRAPETIGRPPGAGSSGR